MNENCKSEHESGGPAIEFQQLDWNQDVQQWARQLIQMALQEDLGGQRDWTTWATIDRHTIGDANFVNRVPGVVCGLQLISLIVEELASLENDSDGSGSNAVTPPTVWTPWVDDGTLVEPQTILGNIKGSARTILQLERTALNFMGRLSGISTLTSQFVNQIKGTKAKIYDTRKTTPGWRLLEKYAVRCGGGQNHRLGLYAAVMLKDNHLAGAGGQNTEGPSRTGNDAAANRLRTTVLHAKQQLQQAVSSNQLRAPLIFEVEVDSIQQLEALIDLDIDIILLDNMDNQTLRRAVKLRDQKRPVLQLEASGGVNLASVAGIAATGVERISSGALTHSAINWDVGLDWV